MRMRLAIPIDHVVPSEHAVLAAQGIPDPMSPEAKHRRLAQEAIALYRSLARPDGVILEIEHSEFATVYHGEGRNERPAPVELIYPMCDRLALLAVTIGDEICQEISRLFALNEFALGLMLDSAASEGTELAAAFAGATYARHYIDEGHQSASGFGLLCFSPGYCGWDMSGQMKLFEALHPTEIGISLNPSYLMNPLKSISGVILVGPKKIFAFEDDYPFCSACETRPCRDRLKEVMEQRW
jgi:hypothetical protein